MFLSHSFLNVVLVGTPNGVNKKKKYYFPQTYVCRQHAADDYGATVRRRSIKYDWRSAAV